MKICNIGDSDHFEHRRQIFCVQVDIRCDLRQSIYKNAESVHDQRKEYHSCCYTDINTVFRFPCFHLYCEDGPDHTDDSGLYHTH